MRVSSNSLNEVFLHTQIKKIQKDEQQSRFNYILHQIKPLELIDCHEIFQVFNLTFVFLRRKRKINKISELLIENNEVIGH